MNENYFWVDVLEKYMNINGEVNTNWSEKSKTFDKIQDAIFYAVECCNDFQYRDEPPTILYKLSPLGTYDYHCGFLYSDGTGYEFFVRPMEFV